MKIKLKLIALMIVASITLLGVVWFALYQYTLKEDTSKGLSADNILDSSFEADLITTNLGSGGYIKVRFRIQASSEEAKEELAQRDFQVRNIVLKLASSMTDVEAKSPNGNEKIENEMKNELNKLMQSGSIIRVYTTDKIVQ